MPLGIVIYTKKSRQPISGLDFLKILYNYFLISNGNSNGKSNASLTAINSF